MKLFYLKEHLSCFNYAKFEAEGFSYYKLEKGTMLEEETTKGYDFVCFEREYIV